MSFKLREKSAGKTNVENRRENVIYIYWIRTKQLNIKAVKK